MSNWLAKFGAQPSKPVRYGVLWQGRFATGEWSQRSPLRDAASTRIEEEFYGARGDALYSGLNCEISPKLTMIRRPGNSVYNSQNIPAINRYYGFSAVVNNQEQIHVLADVKANSSPLIGPTVRDVTGPNTNKILWNKLGGSKTTSFQGVGNTAYFSDGVSANKLIVSPLIWQSSTSYTSGQFIVDPNGNLQLNLGSQTATIEDIQITAGTATLFFTPGTSLTIPVGASVTLAGLTTVPALNATTQAVTAVTNTQQVQFANGGTQSFAAETGTATTGSGVSGLTQPAWATSVGSVTQDGGAQWVCRGSQVEMWGISTPTSVPVVTQALAPSIYSSWAASTWYAPLFVILDTNNNLQQLTSIGSAPHQTGGSSPTWNVTVGGTTTDGDITWTNIGTGTWVASHSYAVGDIVQVTFTYYITETVQDGYDPYTYQPIYVTQQVPITVTCQFKCTTAGISGLAVPSWTNGVGTTVNDNTVVWTNSSGSTLPAWPGATQTLSLTTSIIDSNNSIEKATLLGKTGPGPSAPIWATTTGGYTTDLAQLWQNAGPFGQANTAAWIYGYSYHNSITGHTSTSSQQSASILVSANNLAVIQGVGSGDSQVDSIIIWRTVQGGSQLFYLDQIPNPGGGVKWTYTDTTPDTSLNEFISAPIDGANNPPPTGLLALSYHLGRIWGAVNNLVYFSTGPDVTAGNGNEAWSASNVFAFPDTVTRLFPTSSGLLVFTVSDIYIIQGLGTSSSALFSAPFLKDIGLASYDAFAINGSIVYMYSSDNQVLTLDPSAGVSEIGFPIGDQFGPGEGTGTFSPSQACVTWHVAGSRDKGLYVSDFQGIWWRMTPTPSPETGTTWSPKAQIVGGFSAVQSIEVLPGTHELLLGAKTYGPILKRDYTVYTDNGSAYSAWALLGSMVLAQPGQIASVQSFTTDSVAVGTPITLAVQLDEIAPYYGLSSASINAPGAGYALGDIVSVIYPGGAGGLLKITNVSGGAVTAVSILLPGEGYPVTGAGLATSGGSGTGLTVNVTAYTFFETLSDSVPDPTELEPSVSVYAQRFYLSQTQKPAKCRHLQVIINWGTDPVKNELMSFSVFGSFEQEM